MGFGEPALPTTTCHDGGKKPGECKTGQIFTGERELVEVQPALGDYSTPSEQHRHRDKFGCREEGRTHRQLPSPRVHCKGLGFWWQQWQPLR